MESGSSRYLFSLITLLAFLLTGPAEVQGYVWCLGNDGHAALEFVAGDSCDPVLPGPNPGCDEEAVSDLPSGDEHCGPCSDLPASIEAAASRHKSQNDLSLAPQTAAAAPAVAPPPFIRVLTANLQPNPPPRTSQTLLAHRTVVLLN